MKLKFKIVLLSVAVSIGINAQKLDKENLSYHYQRNPLERLDPSIKNYIVEVNVPWIEGENQKEAAYQAELEEAEADYNKAMEEYNSKSTGSKILEKTLLEEGKPTKRRVPKPYFIPQPSLPSIASSIALDGYGTLDQDAVTIKVVYHDIFIGTPSDETKTKSEVHYKTRTVAVKQPVEFTLIDQYGEIIYTEVLESSSNDYPITSKDVKLSEWTKYERDEWDAYFTSRLQGYYKKLSKDINNAINHRFGYSKVKRNTTLFMGDGKKYSYESHMLALRKAQRAYEALYTEREESVEKLKESIAVWEKELDEAVPGDKKARISPLVMQALIVNIIEANILIGEYNTAEDYCDKVDILPDVKRKHEKIVEDLRKFLRDEKQRNPKG